jgi:hypothetical protein
MESLSYIILDIAFIIYILMNVFVEKKVNEVKLVILEQRVRRVQPVLRVNVVTRVLRVNGVTWVIQVSKEDRV